MKLRFLLISMCLLATMGKVQAQWSDQYTSLETYSAVNDQAAVITASGDVIITGILSRSFLFGNYNLQPVGESSYLLKYNSDGAKQWAVAFAGSATPTAMTTDDSGNIYVAGIYGGSVTLNSTDNKSQSIPAIRAASDEDTEQRNGFIAKYSAAGVLLQVQEYRPSVFEESKAEGLMYYPNLTFMVTDMTFSEGRLLASVKYCGVVESNGHTIKASYYNQAGIFFNDVPAGAILEINKDALMIDKVYAIVQPENDIANANVKDIRITSSGGQLFGAFFAIGEKQNLTIKDETQSINFPYDDEKPSGHIFVHLDLATGDRKSVNTSYTQKSTDETYSIGSLDYADGKLIISGTFCDFLVFKPELESTGVTDVFVAVLDANNMRTVDFVVSTTTDEAVFGSSTLSGNQFLVSCNESDKYGILATKLTDGSTMTYTTGKPDVFSKVIASKDGTILKVETILENSSSESVTTEVTVEKQNTGINDPGSATDVAITFDATESRLSFSETADALIYNSTGMLVRTVNKSQSVNLSELPKGIYVVSAQTANGSSRLKFFKR